MAIRATPDPGLGDPAPGGRDRIERNIHLETELGPARVQPGTIVVERSNQVWVCPLDQLEDFIERLELAMETTITNIGPGKLRQFGIFERPRSRLKEQELNGEPPNYPPARGSFPSIEWIHVGRLSVDGIYQRSTDNPVSHRLIAGIAARLLMRRCPRTQRIVMDEKSFDTERRSS